MARKAAPFEQRFWRNVPICSAEECWNWSAGKHWFGYGTITKPGSNPLYAHRVMYELTRGVTLTRADHICHRCDNPSCVNPAHLFLGTQQDNMADCAAKGRIGNQHGGMAMTHCRRGHEFTPENTRWVGPRKSRRSCRECERYRFQRRAA